MPVMQIEQEVFLATDVEHAWAVLTQAEHLGTWFGDTGASIDLRPGGALELHWLEYATRLGTVVTVEPEEVFSFIWSRDELPPRPGHSTMVEFSLREDKDGVWVKVIESGFHLLAAPPDEQSDYAAGNLEAWQVELGHLQAYVAAPTN